MRVLGADLGSLRGEGAGREATLVLVDDEGRIVTVRHAESLHDLARETRDLAESEPFVLAVDIPVVVPERAARRRPVDRVARRRLGWRPPALPGSEPTGPSCLAALSALGIPCVPWPDRDRRQSGLAEIHAPLSMKSLLWEGSPAAATPSHPDREAAFRACAAPAYRKGTAATRATWSDRAAALDLSLRAVGFQEGFDFKPAWEALGTAATDAEVERAAGLCDAALLAGTALRYLEDPETCLFLGDRDSGYMILPADGFLRRMTRVERGRPVRQSLFPKQTLEERLEGVASLRPLELLASPGRGGRFEAIFDEPPRYEFDNVDEMLWWKHCRHLAGPEIPTEGLIGISVRLGLTDDAATPPEPPGGLRLERSRHRTLSFRFEPAAVWRARIRTRDGATYPFRVLRAVYETR